jgi:hypothetical protein
MSVEIDERGYFWWADEPVPQGHFAPSSAVPGRVRISSNGRTKLELDGILPLPAGKHDINVHGIPGKPSATAVVGSIRGGHEYVRLEKLSQAGLRFPGKHPPSESKNAIFCILGVSLVDNKTQEPYCTGIKIPLSGFHHWLLISAGEIKNTDKDFSFTIQNYITKSFNISDAIVRVGTSVISFPNLTPQRITIQNEGYIDYFPNTPISLDQVNNIVRKIEDLLIILTDVERSLGSVKIQVNGKDIWSDLRYENAEHPEVKMEIADLWTTFPQISAQFGYILETWITKSEILGPAIYLYLGTRRGMPLYVEHRLVNLVWGIESFHRTTANKLINLNLTKKIERILSAVDTKDRKWLSKILEKTKEIRLEERIYQTLRRIPLEFESSSLKKFAKLCADERNSISHFGGPRDGQSYEDSLKKWSLIIDSLDILYHFLILTEIGVGNNIIENIFWKMFPSYRFRETLSRAGILLCGSTASQP